ATPCTSRSGASPAARRTAPATTASAARRTPAASGSSTLGCGGRDPYGGSHWYAWTSRSGRHRRRAPPPPPPNAPPAAPPPATPRGALAAAHTDQHRPLNSHRGLLRSGARLRARSASAPTTTLRKLRVPAGTRSSGHRPVTSRSLDRDAATAPLPVGVDQRLVLDVVEVVGEVVVHRHHAVLGRGQPAGPEHVAGPGQLAAQADHTVLDPHLHRAAVGRQGPFDQVVDDLLAQRLVVAQEDPEQVHPAGDAGQPAGPVQHREGLDVVR